MRFTSAFRPNPRTSTYTSTTLRIVPAASAALFPATVPYRCDTADATAVPPVSIRRTADADSAARMSDAESAARVRVRRGNGGGAEGGVGDDPREPAGDVPCLTRRGGRGGLSCREDGGAGEGPRLREGSGGFPGDCGGVGAAETGAEARPLPLSAPTARWMSRSAAAMALWLSFTASPLTAWMLARWLRVVGDCRRRSGREGGGGGVMEEEEVPGPAAAPGVGDTTPEACGEGVELAM